MRNETLDQLAAVGFDPGLLDRPQGRWETRAPWRPCVGRVSASGW